MNLPERISDYQLIETEVLQQTTRADMSKYPYPYVYGTIEGGEISDYMLIGSKDFRRLMGITLRRNAFGIIVNEVFNRGNLNAFNSVSAEEAARDASGLKRIARRILDEPIRRKKRLTRK